jgi:hypothetical protein
VRYQTPKCPECGEILQGECDMTPGCAEVEELPDGTFDYTGNTEMFWDGQVNEHDLEVTTLAFAKGETPVLDKLVRVQCHNAHMWLTEVDHSEPKEVTDTQQ